MKFEQFTLNNNIRLIHHEAKSKIGYLALIINTGSRDENEKEHGIAHFTEHMLFKGTNKRKAQHISDRLDNTGGELNAYTSKEDTCIQATFLEDDFDKAIELIADIVFNSTFLEKEIEKEREIILDEIDLYKDSPSDQIYEDFEELLFDGSKIGRGILGTPTSLEGIKRDDFFNFISKKYNTDEMILCCSANISFKKFCKKATKYFEGVATNNRTIQRKKPMLYVPQKKIVTKDTHQAHCVMGCRAYDIYDKKQYPFLLLNNMLAGPSLNSLLGNSLREKYGLVYNIESSFSSFTDTGVFSIYFGTNKKNLDQCTSLIKKELDKLLKKGFTDRQTEKAKKQLTGQICIAYEQREMVMMAAAKRTLHNQHIRNIDEMTAIIAKISSKDLNEVAHEILNFDKLTMLSYF